MSFTGDTKSDPALLPQTPPKLPQYHETQLYADVEGHPQGVLAAPARQPRSLARRVLRGVLFIFVTLWIVSGIHRVFLGRPWFSRHKEFDMGDHDYYYDIPSDLILENCVEGDGWSVGEDDGPFSSASATFDVDLTVDNIYLLSRGRFSGGIVNVITSSEQPKEFVTIDVVVKYRRHDMLDWAKACFTSRPQNQKGVGIFTPIWRRSPRHGHDQNILHFETTITLPEDVSITSFETDVPNTVQIIRDLGSKVDFKSVALMGSNMPIHVESLSAVKGLVHSSNAGIRGTFNTTSSLILETSNAPIAVAVGLNDDGKHPSLAAHTTNAHFDARLSLTTPSGELGNFTVDTTTTNSPLRVVFVDAPLDSGLEYSGRSANGKVDVTLHPTYEGNFDMSTSRYFRADLKFLPAPDPSGQGRKRASFYQGDRHRNFGNTKWLENENPVYGPKDNGNVVISTSNSPIVLNILGI
ncbi:hypothetical protein BDN70DRAFT_878881 [Pholiota conissans]|uniref:Uncharacterized protein n=1 Tax=Pholiota conissans TaxID=109636 RepID=A0A9P5Z298_9AGAR|nr:hypothetical protein BDN70DRAFT_878881 [Pholiota conissans]